MDCWTFSYILTLVKNILHTVTLRKMSFKTFVSPCQVPTFFRRMSNIFRRMSTPSYIWLLLQIFFLSALNSHVLQYNMISPCFHSWWFLRYIMLPYTYIGYMNSWCLHVETISGFYIILCWCPIFTLITEIPNPLLNS